MNRILVTSYLNPDLDGCASMVSYAELLRQKGQDAVAGYFGQPQQDAMFGFERFGVTLPEKAQDVKYDEIVLVDVSNVQRLDLLIDPKKVAEIIDHHEPHLEDFPNAKAQIEHLGAAATLVAERWKQSGLKPDEKQARFLHLAIIHGTLNFKAKVSTKKDSQMAEWLGEIAPLSKQDVDDFFELLVSFPEPLADFLRDDFKDFDVKGTKFGIAAILVFGRDEFLDKYKAEVLEALETLKQEKSLHYIWFDCVDLKDGTSYLLVPDEKTEKLVSEGLKMQFSNREARSDEIVLRKEHLKMMSEYLRSKK